MSYDILFRLAHRFPDEQRRKIFLVFKSVTYRYGDSSSIAVHELEEFSKLEDPVRDVTGLLHEKLFPPIFLSEDDDEIPNSHHIKIENLLNDPREAARALKSLENEQFTKINLIEIIKYLDEKPNELSGFEYNSNLLVTRFYWLIVLFPETLHKIFDLTDILLKENHNSLSAIITALRRINENHQDIFCPKKKRCNKCLKYNELEAWISCYRPNNADNSYNEKTRAIPIISLMLNRLVANKEYNIKLLTMITRICHLKDFTQGHTKGEYQIAWVELSEVINMALKSNNLKKKFLELSRVLVQIGKEMDLGSFMELSESCAIERTTAESKEVYEKIKNNSYYFEDYNIQEVAAVLAGLGEEQYQNKLFMSGEKIMALVKEARDPTKPWKDPFVEGLAAALVSLDIPKRNALAISNHIANLRAPQSPTVKRLAILK